MSEIALIGDIAFTGIISSEPGKNTERYSHIVPILNKAELVFANLEVPVKSDNERNEYKNIIHFSGIQATESLLKLLNISCVSLANNHIYDCKMSGLRATISLLDQLGIYHTGAGWKAEHLDPVTIVCNGIRIGFMAFVDKSTNPETEKFPELYINYFEPENVKTRISELRSEVDIIICSIHWGMDYSYYPTPEQIRVARELVDGGADIIMGHHTHTLQPFEIHQNAYIFYSLGSFTFGDYIREGKNEIQSLFRKTKKSVIVKYSFSSNQFGFVSTKELRGNYIITDKRDYNKWTSRKWSHFKIRHLSGIIEKLYVFNEQVLYRIYEYFFGYYKNPLKRLFQISNLKKVPKLFK